jgi:hypothetical protein
MPLEQDERFQLDVEPLDPLKQQIQRQKAETANRIAIALVSGVLLSPVIYLAAILWRAESSKEIHLVFDKWFSLVGPLAGAAVGAYYSSRSHD